MDSVQQKFDQRLPGPNDSQNRQTARSLYATRRERDRLFGDDVFSDTGWDIALLLFANGPEATVVTESQISDELGASEHTVCRYVQALERQGLVIKDSAKSTLEMLALRLTDKAISFMEATFAAHQQHFVPLPFDTEDKD